MDEDQFEQALQDVEGGGGPTSEHLAGLAHLAAEQVARFGPVWNGLDEKQKLALLDALSRAEEETLRLEFNEIYHLGMGDQSAPVRRRAIEAIVEDDSAWLLQTLLRLVEEEDAADVRAAAAAALEAFARRAELDELPPESAERVRAALLETLHRPGERLDVRAEALASLGYFSDARTRLEIEQGFADEGLRLHALRAMGHSADAAWLGTLQGQLEDSDDALRAAAASAAGEIGEDSIVPSLVDLIDDPALQVRLAAIEALGDIGGDESREALVYALEDKRPSVRRAAQAALEEIDFFEDPLAT